MKLFILLVLSLLTISTALRAQTEVEFNIEWKEEMVSLEDLETEKELNIPSFWGAFHGVDFGFAPIYTTKITLGRGQIASSVIAEVSETTTLGRDAFRDLRGENSPQSGWINWHTREERGQNVVIIEYYPVAGSEANPSFVSAGKFRITTGREAPAARAKSGFAASSVLANGDWYRIAVLRDGVYRINRAFLQSLGVDVNNLNPQNLNIYGNGYGQLPFDNSVERPDDLLLNNIYVEGEADGSFDEQDYILFYAKGPHTWSYNQSQGLFNHHKHNYCDTSYYFIGINTGSAASRISTLPPPSQGSNYTVSSFNDYTFHEVDRENLIKTGREWYGEKFDVQTTFNFSGSQFTFPNILPDSETVVRANAVGRSTAGNTSFAMTVGGATNTSVISGTGTGVTSIFANQANVEVRLNTAAPALNINLTYNKGSNPSAAAWLNWLNVNTRRQLRMVGSQMIFRDIESVGPGRVSQFQLGNSSGVAEVWDVTEPSNARRVSLNRNGDIASFGIATNELREFVAISGTSFLTPTAAGRVQNQDLHSLGLDQRVDMVIVTPNQLVQGAEALANIHRNYAADPLNVEVVRLQHIYNEFSSGMRDITAIKWLMKMLYDRAGGNEAMMPRYLLLFGDGSFDNRNTTPGNTNLVPTYQSLNSLSPASSYVSDDYFGFLGDNEGESQVDIMDVGVGRITVKNQQEATSVVNKIRRYTEVEGNIAADCTVCNDAGGGFGPWRNIIALVADDGDGNQHMNNSRLIANRINSYTRAYNLERIFLDAFQLIATPGGARFPDANAAIDRRVQNGAFIMNYIGHGGVAGWAQERILDVPTILDWTNQFAMPIFMTATCEFTRFDDPLRTSAGEYVLLNGNGGGVALLTTTRLVYSFPNFALNENFYDALFNRPSGEVVTRLGDVSRDTKNASVTSGSSNHRNFSLIGDPALPMAIPKNRVEITAITDTLGNPVDTLKALGVFRVAGEVRNGGGALMSGFNGRLNATVFDREKEVTTLANTGGNPFIFKQQEDVVHRGNAEVVSGRFSFDFVIPKDISFAVDSTARISVYAFDANSDARGFKNDLKIGDRDTNAVDDGTGPEISLFLNDENFVFGGYTNDTPTLIAKVFDKSGINTVGTGVGHDITATLNNDPRQTFLLNDFYESDLNTFQSGKIVYPFDKLEPGNYDITLKVWNVHNRSSEEKTSFIVSDSEEFAIKRLLNYPNPFTTHTDFFFEHNQSCAFLNVLVQVFTVSGKLVKSIVTVSNTDGFRNEAISWDGRDDYGDRLATGVYVYKVSVRNPAGDQVEKFEKLVILN